MDVRCEYGVCNSESRHYHLPHMKGVVFSVFPQDLERRRNWVRACGREDFPLESVKTWMHICSKHFVGGKEPSREYPDPIPSHLSEELYIERRRQTHRVSKSHSLDPKRRCIEKSENLQQKTLISSKLQHGTLNLKSRKRKTSDLQSQTRQFSDLQSGTLNRRKRKSSELQNKNQQSSKEGTIHSSKNKVVTKKKNFKDKCTQTYSEDNLRYASTQTTTAGIRYASVQTNTTSFILSDGPGHLLANCHHLLSQLVHYFIMGWTLRVTFKTVSLILIDGNSCSITISIDRATGAFVIYTIDKPIEADSELNKCLGELKDRAILEVVDLMALMNIVRRWRSCPGYKDVKQLQSFMEMPAWASEMFIRESTSSVHSLQCEQISPEKTKCEPCRKIGSKIIAKAARLGKPNLTPCTSLKNSNREDLISRCKELKNTNKMLKQRVSRMSEKVEKLVIENQAKVIVPPNPLEELLNEFSPGACAEDVKLYLEQQKAAFRCSSRSMRWHPTILRWCVSIYTLSPPAYEAIRQPGFVKLPTSKTIKKLKNGIKNPSGFNESVCEELKKLFAVNEDTPTHEKEVCLVLKKMLNVTDVTNPNRTNEKNDIPDIGPETENAAGNEMETDLSTHVLAFIVRGSCNTKTINFAHFPVATLTTPELTNYVLEAVSLIESVGLRVLCVTVDWGSCNRDLFSSLADKELPCPYKFRNEAAEEERYVYLICDPPYLYDCGSEIGEKLEASEYFKMLDKWFDLMNTRKRIRERVHKPFKRSNLDLAPYKKNNYKERLDWLRNVFLPFFDNWKEEFLRNLNSNEGKEQMFQHIYKAFRVEELHEGLRITVHSVLEIVPYLLEIGALEVMTTYLNPSRFKRSKFRGPEIFDHDYTTVETTFEVHVCSS